MVVEFLLAVPSSLGYVREKVEVIIIQNWGFIGKMSMKTNGMKKVKMFTWEAVEGMDNGI